jgi:hypothetical protein
MVRVDRVTADRITQSLFQGATAGAPVAIRSRRPMIPTLPVQIATQGAQLDVLTAQLDVLTAEFNDRRRHQCSRRMGQ